jgi:hypothetical protein
MLPRPLLQNLLLQRRRLQKLLLQKPLLPRPPLPSLPQSLQPPRFLLPLRLRLKLPPHSPSSRRTLKWLQMRLRAQHPPTPRAHSQKTKHTNHMSWRRVQRTEMLNQLLMHWRRCWCRLKTVLPLPLRMPLMMTLLLPLRSLCRSYSLQRSSRLLRRFKRLRRQRLLILPLLLPLRPPLPQQPPQFQCACH